MAACDLVAGELCVVQVQCLKMRQAILQLRELEGLPAETKGKAGLTAGELVRLLETEVNAMAVAAVSAWGAAQRCAPPPVAVGRVVSFPGVPGHHPGPAEGDAPPG